MKAIVHQAFGEPASVLSLRDMETPGIGPSEVLLHVRATAVAKGDWLIAHGLPYIARPSYGIRKPRHRIPGLEVAGVVTAVGDQVTHLSAGDEVFGWTNGGLAEYAAVPGNQLTPKPAGITFEEAAAITVSGSAALQAVRDAAGVTRDDQVLIIGAPGGVGSFAVQIAKALGAEVTGVASSRNLELVRSLGADHVIDYTKEQIGHGGRKYDVVIDIAGNRRLSELRGVLRRKGTSVIVGGSGGKTTMGFGRTIRAVLVSPFVSQRLRALISKPNQTDLKTLAEMIEAGTVRPRVTATYPLSEAAKAIELVGAGRSSGKTVVAI